MTAEIENKALLRGLSSQVQEQLGLIKQNKAFNLQLGPPVMEEEDLDPNHIAQLDQDLARLKREGHEDHPEVERLRNQAVSTQDAHLLTDAMQLAANLLGANV